MKKTDTKAGNDQAGKAGAVKEEALDLTGKYERRKEACGTPEVWTPAIDSFWQ